MSQFGFRISDFGLKSATLALITVGIAAEDLRAEVVLTAERGNVVARAVIDRNQVELSGEVVLTLAVQGLERIDVTPPRPLLTKTSALSWRIRETGLPIVEKLKDGGFLWKQQFQLAPFEAGGSVAIELEPIKVKAGNQKEAEITFLESAKIAVTTTAKADVNTLRPITEIESLPPAPPLFTPRSKPWMLVGLGISLVLIVGAFILIVIRRKQPEEPHLTGAPRALRDLNALRHTAANLVGVADVLRVYVQDRTQILALRLTTSEVVIALQKDHPQFAPFVSTLQEVLERCDLAKFAGGNANESDSADCINRAISFVERTATLEPPANPA